MVKLTALASLFFAALATGMPAGPAGGGGNPQVGDRPAGGPGAAMSGGGGGQQGQRPEAGGPQTRPGQPGGMGPGGRPQGDGHGLTGFGGKPPRHRLGYELGKYHISVDAVVGDRNNSQSYSFFFTPLGMPRFSTAYANRTAQGHVVASDFIIQKIIEFEDSNAPGYDTNDTVLSEIDLFRATRSNSSRWSEIAYSNTTVDNATVIQFSTGSSVNGTQIKITSLLSSEVVLVGVNKTAVLQPISLKFELSVQGYNYIGSNSTLAFVALVRTQDSVRRVVRDVIHRNETEVHGNRTARGNETHLAIGGGHARIAFGKHADGSNDTRPVHIAPPANAGRDDAEADNKERQDRERMGPMPEFPRIKDANVTRIVISFGSSGSPVAVSFASEIFISSNASSLTSAEVEKALEDPATAAQVFGNSAGLDVNTAATSTSDAASSVRGSVLLVSALTTAGFVLLM